MPMTRWTCTRPDCTWHVTETGPRESAQVVLGKCPRPPRLTMAEAVAQVHARENGIVGAVRAHLTAEHGIRPRDIGPEHLRGGWARVSRP